MIDQTHCGRVMAQPDVPRTRVPATKLPEAALGKASAACLVGWAKVFVCHLRQIRVLTIDPGADWARLHSPAKPGF
jgi:hypothetical protein